MSNGPNDCLSMRECACALWLLCLCHAELCLVSEVMSFASGRNMSSLKAICTHLDVISLSVFETLDEIYMCQANLETTLKNGHLLMAKVSSAIINTAR